jgi:thiamine pyrophosphate-dependent acetolactate synthase large subunit-like protein
MAYGKTVETDLLDVDYSEVARALKCQGERIQNPNQIRGALESAFQAKGPYVVDMVVDPYAIAPLVMFDGFDASKAGN